MHIASAAAGNLIREASAQRRFRTPQVPTQWTFGGLALSSTTLPHRPGGFCPPWEDPFDDIRQGDVVLTAVSGGQLVIETGTGVLSLEPGQCLVVDGDECLPAWNSVVTCHTATLALLRIPRRMLASPHRKSSAPNLDPVHVRRLEGDGAAILSDHLAALLLYLSLMAGARGEALAATTVRLVEACLAQDLSRQGTAVLSRRFWLHRVWRHIEQNLHKPELSPQSICHALGLSRSTLYRHFSPIGGLAAYIGRRRVEEIRKFLHDPEEIRSISELAMTYGFASSATFASFFKRWFGCNPSSERLGFAVDAQCSPFGSRGLFS